MSQTPRIPWYRNPKTRAIIVQLVVIAAVVWALGTIFSNTMHNLEVRGIQTGFGFLTSTAPFGVGFSPFIDFTLGESQYWRVFLIGIQNTMIVSVLGILAANILGFLIGVLRLSPNWLIARFAQIYIEIFRNIPLLLQIMFWNFAVFLPLLPAPRQSLGLGESAFLNNRGMYLPRPVVENSTGLVVVGVIVLAAIAGAVWLRRWARLRQDRTGERFPALLTGIAGVVVAAVVGYFIAGRPLGVDYPALETFNFQGGMRIPLPLFSLWFALSTYTAAFIAENVRGGIVAVSHGQTEAAGALGLSRNLTLRLVIIPQAMRVIIPPTISQCLNLTKNSSLAVAVAYEELVSLWAGISLNQTGQALIIIAMTIAVYESLSLITSGILNWYNRRVQMVER